MHGYSETILKYAGDDSHTGELVEPDGIGEVGLGAEEIGRKLAVRFMLKRQGERVDAIRYQVFGCGYTMAACAAAAELGEGLSLAELEDWSAERISERLGGLPQERDYCAEVAAEALRAAAASVRRKEKVETTVDNEEHGAHVSVTHPVYRALIGSPLCADADLINLHLFACLLAVSSEEPWAAEASLGLDAETLDALLQRFFPEANWTPKRRAADVGLPPEINVEVRELLRSYVKGSPDPQLAAWLADILAARAAHPGHLWVAMGLFERPELSAAIDRILPSLKEANDKGMRWKRYLFKQVCEQNGGQMCKTPNCADCSDYPLCYAPED